MWINDLAKAISDAGLGTLNVSLFLSTSANIPAGDGPFTLIITTTGTTGEKTHNRNGVAYERPGAIIVVRHKSALEADRHANRIQQLLETVKNQEINDTHYVNILPLGLPYDAGKDEVGRAMVRFHLIGWKRPTVIV